MEGIRPVPLATAVWGPSSLLISGMIYFYAHCLTQGEPGDAGDVGPPGIPGIPVSLCRVAYHKEVLDWSVS